MILPNLKSVSWLHLSRKFVQGLSVIIIVFLLSTFLSAYLISLSNFKQFTLDLQSIYKGTGLEILHQ